MGRATKPVDEKELFLFLGCSVSEEELFTRACFHGMERNGSGFPPALKFKSNQEAFRLLPPPGPFALYTTVAITRSPVHAASRTTQKHKNIFSTEKKSGSDFLSPIL